MFALRDINLTKIESRPMRSTPILYELDNGRRSYNYVFFIDLIGSTAEARARLASCESQLWCVFRANAAAGERTCIPDYDSYVFLTSLAHVFLWSSGPSGFALCRRGCRMR